MASNDLLKHNVVNERGMSEKSRYAEILSRVKVAKLHRGNK